MKTMERRLEGKTVVVLAEDLYEDLELWYPTLRLREEGATVIVAGTGARSYRGKNGYPVDVDTSASKLSASDLDAIVVPGGYAPDRLRRYPDVLALVGDASRQGKVVAAICHAAWVLISAGVVRGKRATCFSSIKDDLVNAGALYEDAPVVVDGTLITSRQPSDLGHFCRAIIVALAGER